MVWISVKGDAAGGGWEGAVTEAPATATPGSICPAFQPRRWEADGAGAGRGEVTEELGDLPSNQPPGRWGGVSESLWGMQSAVSSQKMRG